MLIKQPDDIKPSEITSKSDYLNRRAFMRNTGLLLGGAWVGAELLGSDAVMAATKKLEFMKKTTYGQGEKVTDFKYTSRYNNFYEFSLDKKGARKKAENFKTDPWSLEIAGEVEKKGVFQLEDILKPHTLEQRIYRFRCVEAWAMVVPWIGIPLASVLKQYQPTSKAKYVSFETLHDPAQMPGQKSGVLEWPYREGLRMDEAMHPLTFLAVGMYDETLPNQNGAPIRLVVPWKYGFKSIKSIVKIELTEKQPKTTWSDINNREYGFFANVNPEVDHPRWSQAKHRVLGGGVFSGKEKTKPFNGYEKEVSSLYKGMDLSQFF